MCDNYCVPFGFDIFLAYESFLIYDNYALLGSILFLRTKNSYV